MSRPSVCSTGLRRRRRRGAALLEAIVALTILATVGLAVVAFAAESGRALVRVRNAEREVRKANELLEAVALWPRADLDRHLGDRQQGPWRMQVQRLTPTLYNVTITDSTRQREILHTSLYRPVQPENATSEAGHGLR